VGIGEKFGKLMGLPTKEDRELMDQTKGRLELMGYPTPPTDGFRSLPGVIVRVGPTAGLLDVFDTKNRPIGMINTATGEITYAPRQ
jgi:hypothetical protein